MKKSALLFLFTAFFACLAFSQNPQSGRLSGVQFLRFSPSEKVGVGSFRQGDSPVRFALPPGDSLALQKLTTDRCGNRRYRLQQMHAGIPVFGADALLLEENGVLALGKGRFRQNFDTEVVPALSEKNALVRALDALPADKYAWQIPAFERELKTATANPAATFAPAGKLIFLPQHLADPSSGSIRLAWQFDLFAIEPTPARSLIFVDALNGEILYKIPLLHNDHAPAQGFARYVADTVGFNTEQFNDTLYRLRDLIRNIHIRDALNLHSNPNVDFVHNSTFWNKPEHRTPVAAIWGMEKWYDYMLKERGWRGFANDSTPMPAWVHFGQNFNNAFWNGNWINFGDGDGVRFEPLVQLDIVAHECAHALVQNTCGLIYQGEPGALNEGLCDIFATLVERYAFPDSWNWKLGEAAYFDHANGLRRLDYPNVTGHPDTYGGQFWVNTDGCAPGATNDQCGIHANCGVVGKFFYVLAQGETGVNEFGTPYSVAGIGLDKSADILFQSLKYLLPTDGFADMRAATLDAAFELFPGTETEVAKAWCAVGVGECAVTVSDSIVLTAPAVVDTFQHGQSVEVLWTASAGVQYVNLYLSLNDGASWQLVHSKLDAAAGQFEWAAPPVFSPVCRLRIADADNPFVSDRTDTTFVITGCEIKAHFTSSLTTVCFGQPFFAANDSPDQSATFQWRWNGADYTTTDSLLEIPAMTIPGNNSVDLIADDGAGCRDTFSLNIKVLPQLTAQFSVETHGTTLVANAHYQGADTYIWIYGGQQVGGNSPAISLTGLAAGADSLRLIVAENGCPGGVGEAVQGVTVVSAVQCTGNDLEVWQVTGTNDVIDIAERGDKLYLAIPGCAAELDKNTFAFKIFKPGNTNGMLSLPVSCVTVRQDGRVLFGTKYCGIAVYNPADSTWAKIQNTSWLPSNQIEKMETGANGDTWILTKFESDRQLVKWTLGDQIFYFPVLYNIIKSMAPIGDDLWFVGNSGPNYFKKATIQNGLGKIEDVTEPSVLQNTHFRCMGSNGQKIWLWVLNTYSLIEVDLSSGISIIYNSTNSGLPASGILVDAIESDHNGGAWLMTGNKPYHYDGAGNFSVLNDPVFNTGFQNVIFPDGKDRFWLGARTGLRKYANNTGNVIDLSTNGFQSTGFAVTQVADIACVPGGNRFAVLQNYNYFEIENGAAKPIAPGCSVATTKNLTYTFDQTGQHILTLIARNAQGCATAVSKVIEVYPSADLSAVPLTWANCDNSTQLAAPFGMAEYEWRNSGGTIVGAAEKLPVTQSGLYSLKITDHCGGTAQHQITVLLADCVWPGDVNVDGIVDYRDWVLMSLVFGYTGPARDEQDIVFSGHPALPWNGQLPNGANIKHADANGNGIIDMLDFEAIEVNYGKTHGAYPGLDDPKTSPMQFIPVVLESPSDSNGHKMTVGILAVDTSGLLNSFSGTGLVFRWLLPEPVKFAGVPSVNFDSPGYFGKEGWNVKSLYWLKPDGNELHLARAPLDHQNRHNVSLVAQVDFIVIEDNIGIGDTLNIVFNIFGAQALTSDGMFLPVGADQAMFTIIGGTVQTGGIHSLEKTGLLVFPNPSEGVFTVLQTTANPEKTAFTVYDVQGRTVWFGEQAGSAMEIDLSEFPAGAYFLRAVSTKGHAIRQLIKM